MLRTLHVLSSPSGIGGAERIVLELLEAGAQRGNEQKLLLLFGPNRALAEEARLFETTVIEGTMTSLRQVRRALAAEFTTFKPDVAHIHLFHASALCASLPGHLRSKSLLTHHHGDQYAIQHRRLRKWLDKWATRRFPCVVAVSEHGQRYLTKCLGVPPGNVTLIRNGCRTPPSIHERPASPTLVSIGAFRPEKGQEYLLKATAMLRDEFPDIRLILVGDGPSREALKEAIRTLGLSSHVHMTGHVSDILPYLAQASVAVFPSLTEQFGMAVLEALSAGIPVVASAVGGIPELIDDRHSGILVPPKDVTGLASAIGELLTSSDLAAALGRNGRKKALTLPIGDTVEHYLDLYRGMAARSIPSERPQN